MASKHVKLKCGDRFSNVFPSHERGKDVSDKALWKIHKVISTFSKHTVYGYRKITLTMYN